MKRLIPEYADLDRDIEETSRLVERLRCDIREAGAEAAAARKRVRQMLSDLEAPAALEGDPEGTASWLEQAGRDEEHALVDLVGARRELAALTPRAARLTREEAGGKVAELETAAATARSEVERWRTTHGAPLDHTLDELRGPLPGIPAIGGAADPAAVRAEAVEQVASHLAGFERTLAADEATRTEAERLDQAVSAAQRRLTALDEQPE